MSNDKLPALQFYVGDWRKDPGVQSLSYHDRGVWFEIICLMHESPRRGYLLMPNGAPMMSTSLARILGLPTPQVIKTLNRIAEAGVSDRDPDSGALINRRMVRDQKTREGRAEGGKEGAEFGALGGEFGKLGGRPKKGPIEPASKPPLKPAPSSSSSISISSSEEKHKHGAFENVLLTNDELRKLCEQFGTDGTSERIENLSSYIASKNKRYSSHYATILVWERKNRGDNGGFVRNSIKPGAIPPLERPELTPEFIAECERDIARMKGQT